MDRQQLLKRLEHAWRALTASYAGLTEVQITEPGVMETWSVKDILAHVTIWEGKALTYLPLIAQGGTPPRYSLQGGIDAFNAKTMEQKRGLPLAEVLQALEERHRRLIDYRETRARSAVRHGDPPSAIVSGSIPTATRLCMPERSGPGGRRKGLILSADRQPPPM